MDYHTYADQDLIRLITLEHPEALEVLYDRYSKLVFSLAYNSLGERNAAEDIVQEVFTRIWQKADTYQAERGQVTTWLSSITRYRTIDMLRRRGVRPEKSSVSWAELPGGEIADGGATDQIAEQALLRKKVRQAVNKLPIEQRKALALAYFRGYSHREIAENLNEPLGTVKTRIRLGMQKLREYLRDEI